MNYKHPKMDVFWEMPAGFRMPHPDLLNLAEWLLLKKFEDIGPPYNTNRLRGNSGRVAVAYSGGIDSTAALRLVPNPLPIYTRVKPKGAHKLDNALRAVQEVGGISINSNYDELACCYGKRHGFYGRGGFTITAVLLADHFQISTICDGNVLETVYLHTAHGHGTGYNPHDYAIVHAAFHRVALQYCMPCAGLSEVLTTRIAGECKYAMGCMRGSGGMPCGQCMKCYRKEALRGSPIPSNREVEKRLSAPVPAMLPSLLFARDKKGLQHPRLNTWKMDIEWVDKWYPVSIEHIPSDIRDPFLSRLRHFKIDRMLNCQNLHAWGSMPVDAAPAEVT